MNTITRTDAPAKERRDLVLYRRIKAMQVQGAAPSDMAAAIATHVAGDHDRGRDFQLDLRRTESLFRHQPPEIRQVVFPPLLDGMGIHSSERLMLGSLRAGVPLAALASFRVSMSLRARQKQLAPASIAEDRLDSKDDGYRFARALGERVPADDGRIWTWDRLPLEPGRVIKPVHSEGARGAFMLHSPARIIAFKTGQHVTGGFDALRAQLGDMVAAGYVPDAWLSQELVYDDPDAGQPARDLKFFCFYGDIPIIEEVERIPDTRIGWWDGENRPLDLGTPYGDDPPLEGRGVDPAAAAMARRLSLAIPAPFLRIDIMVGHDGPVLGEFTVHPGNYERFAPWADRRLGDAYLAAELRLNRDLMAGKPFTVFRGLFPPESPAAAR